MSKSYRNDKYDRFERNKRRAVRNAKRSNRDWNFNTSNESYFVQRNVAYQPQTANA
jgi:hypothetical protein